MTGDEQAPSRQERRKQQTRAALIKAAQGFIAAGELNAPVQDISRAADVGVGSFYNHFDSKEELFRAAVEDVLDLYGGVLDELTP
ncbi:MAG: TetR/AcrR family transcriptional regulator, partial [Mycobacteriaceae bacterium]|nr:TetR/AcrR family transcriptional regulator [Mycobacteriaceae bacterium]